MKRKNMEKAIKSTLLKQILAELPKKINLATSGKIYLEQDKGFNYCMEKCITAIYSILEDK